MNTRSFASILNALAASEGMIPDPEDRARLADAAAVLDDPARFHTHHPPRVVIVAGEGAEWEAEQLDELHYHLGALRDTLGTMQFSLEQLTAGTNAAVRG